MEVKPVDSTALARYQCKISEKVKHAKSISKSIKGYIDLTNFVNRKNSKMSKEDIHDLNEYSRSRLIEYCSQLVVAASMDTQEEINLKESLYAQNIPLDLNQKEVKDLIEISNEMKDSINLLVDLMVTGILMEKELCKNEDILVTIKKCTSTFNLFKQIDEPEILCS